MGSSTVDEINTAQAGNPHALVLSTFETIWNAVNQFRLEIKVHPNGRFRGDDHAIFVVKVSVRAHCRAKICVM